MQIAQHWAGKLNADRSAQAKPHHVFFPLDFVCIIEEKVLVFPKSGICLASGQIFGRLTVGI